MLEQAIQEMIQEGCYSDVIGGDLILTGCGEGLLRSVLLCTGLWSARGLRENEVGFQL